jgi:hypothetical protein
LWGGEEHVEEEEDRRKDTPVGEARRNSSPC